jgi:hypothetical protein
MLRMKLFGLLMIAAAGGVLAPAGMAQDAEPVDAVFDLLRVIPNSSATRDMTVLADRSAITAAYPEAQMPATIEALLRAFSAGEDVPEGELLWTRVFMNLGDGTAADFRAEDTLRSALGIGFLQIEQVATFGSPPEDGVALAGSFDADAVEAALSARGYVADAGVWCHEGDCTTGMEVNLIMRDPFNPFGGELGRMQPIVADDGVLASTASADVIRDVRAALAGEAASLADVATYQAAAQVLSAQGVVIQATIVDGETLLASSLGDPLPALQGQPQPDLNPIAPYDLYVIADAATATEQVGIAAFVYLDEAAAEAALAEMQNRLDMLSSLTMDRPWTALLQERSLTLSAEVVQADSGPYVALLRFSTPLAGTASILAAPADNPGDEARPAEAYNFLARMLYLRDDQWRWWG